MRTRIDKYEQIIFTAKKHWLMLGKAFLCLALSVAFRLLPIESHMVSITVSVGMVLLAVYLYLDWECDIWVVTNKRVIDEWGVLSSNTRETPLNIIQNVDYHQSIFGQIFNYGDVEIRSAAVEGKTLNRFVTDPKRLKDIIITSKDTKFIKNDERECPDCAEIIKAKARICRFCARAFDNEEIKKID